MMTQRSKMYDVSSQQIRTIWFLVAMIPFVIVAFLASMAALVLLSPVIVYGKIKGIHMKNPWSARSEGVASYKSFNSSAGHRG